MAEDIKEGFSKQLLSSYIDHTLLKPEATEDDIIELCSDAVANNFKSVCVTPMWVEVAKEALPEHIVNVCTVINFPYGNSYSSYKAMMDELIALSPNVDEFDVVLPVALSKQEKQKQVAIDAYLNVCTQALYDNASPKVLKVIIETSALTKEEIKIVCECCMKWRVDFIKTSTGYGTRGATVEDIELIRSIVDDRCKIKASGGIKTFKQVKDLIQAGADRIGTSNAIQILKEWDKL